MEATTERPSGAATSSGKSPRRHGRNRRPRTPPDPLRVIVTGYPHYSQPPDLTRVFTKFGQVNINKMTPKYAVLSFANKEQALEAVKASNKVNVYGEFLVVKQYNDNMASEFKKSSPKRDFTRSKQKASIIEPKEIDLSGTFLEQLERVIAAVRLTQEEVTELSRLYTDVELALQPQWPGCTAIPFGSITTGLGMKSSDADCFVMIPPEYRHPHVNYVNKAKRLLELHPQVFAEILSIPRANTPIVKFFHLPTATACDLTFKTPLGAQNSKLVAALLHADKRLPSLAVAVKYWAKAHDLTGTGRLSNYALTLLLLFYLQQEPLLLLPGVYQLQRDPTRDILVDCWNAGFDPAVPVPATEATPVGMLDLLGGFFRFYSRFDFEKLCVCPFLGEPVSREAFRSPSLLSVEYARYVTNVTAGRAPPLRCDTPLVVQDPFEQCHNVASAVSARLAADIRKYFEFAAEAFEAGEPDRFLPAVLLRHPPALRARTRPEYRLRLPRPLAAADPADSAETADSADSAWLATVRTALRAAFQDLLKIRLEPLDADSDDGKETYAGTVTRAVWKRKRFARFYNSIDLDFREKQARITEEILKADRQKLDVRFQLVLSSRPAALLRLTGGDADAFREFGKFFVAVMQGWLAALLRPPPEAALAARVRALAVRAGPEDEPGEGDADADA